MSSNDSGSAATEPDHLTIDLGHLVVRALVWGEPTAPLVLCLHGYPDSAWTWRYLGPELARAGYRVVAPFTRGYAPSDIPADGDYHVAALATDVLDLHRELGGDDRAILIGHDWGAITVHAIAALPDSPFRRVVAMAVPPLGPVQAAGNRSLSAVRLLLKQATMSWYIGFHQLPALPEWALPRLIPFLWRRWGPAPAASDIDRALDALPTRAHRHAALGYYRALVRPVGRRVRYAADPARYAALARSWLGTPGVPMLYLHGTADGCMDVRFVDRLSGRMPAGSRVVRIDRAGHFAQLDRPDAVREQILSFLELPICDDDGC